MTENFKPFANEADVLRLGDLEIENRLDRVSLTGDLVITRDQVGLTQARQLLGLINNLVKALEAEQELPEVVELRAVKTVKNPFA